MATGDTEFLRLTLNTALRHGLQPISLVHALQNHDELTYELVHFAATHRDEIFHFGGTDVTGAELAIRIRAELIERLTGAAAPYNDIFTTNGIASTTATIVTASLGITDISELNQEAIEEVKQAHLLLAMFNAWQPGVFAFSGWDVCGMLTLERSQVAQLLETGDTRWIHRAAYDLMDYQPQAAESSSQMPPGRSLYGSLAEQLKTRNSFVSRLRDILAVRRRYGIATGTQLDVPAVSDKALLVMVHRLDSGLIQMTALNFSNRPISDLCRFRISFSRRRGNRHVHRGQARDGRSEAHLPRWPAAASGQVASSRRRQRRSRPCSNRCWPAGRRCST